MSNRQALVNSLEAGTLTRAQALRQIAGTQKLTPEAIQRLYDAIRLVLPEWTRRLRSEANGDFPEKVTAFRPEMAVHGRFGKACPVCGTTVNRILGKA